MPWATHDFAHGLDRLPEDAQRRLMLTRGALILTEAAGVALLIGFLDARLPLPALVLILLLHVTLNLFAWWRRRAGGCAAPEVALQLAVDAASIGALVYLTGGYANPFISLLLVPLILAAVMLPAYLAWAMALWVGGLYTLLMHFYHPLVLQVSGQAAVDLHLAGMWLNFLLTAALVAAFVGHLAAGLRRRDAALAEARERRMRDEQLFALGLQAAGAAHDLATPMASMRITVDELTRDYAGDEELAPPLRVLTGQLARMETVLARLARAARARGQAPGAPEPAAEWLSRLLEHWRLMWPDARVDLRLADDLPKIADDPALEGVLVTLLNNAAEVSPTQVALSCGRAQDDLLIEVGDRGGGPDAGKAPGWGVGLELARAALARLGGELQLLEQDGGTLARVRLPLSGRAG
jgi:two-component system sensor histidine kinase RegB